jgi:DNA-binding response OmpR family regulator
MMTGQPPRVLIVEDAPDMNNLVADVLRAYGFEPIQAASAEQALGILSGDRPDAILLDVMLPGASGFELCKHLKSARETRPLPILMMTALGQPADRRQGYETGADDYLTKPFTPDGLVSRLRACLEECGRQRAMGGRLQFAIELSASLADLKAANALATSLFCHADFTPEQIEALRAGVVAIADAAGHWAAGHRGASPVRMTVDLNAERLQLRFQPLAEGADGFLTQHLAPDAAVPAGFTDAGLIDRITQEGGQVILEKLLAPPQDARGPAGRAY